jgi:hypothetical protein
MTHPTRVTGGHGSVPKRPRIDTRMGSAGPAHFRAFQGRARTGCRTLDA